MRCPNGKAHPSVLEQGPEPGGTVPAYQRLELSAGPAAPPADAGISLRPIFGVRCHPALIPYVLALRDAARYLGASFHPVSCYRSPAEQRALLMRWQSGDPSVVFPPAQNSLHLLGLAIDIESNRLADLGRFAEAIGMRWGGRFGDPVHFDLGRR